MEVVEEKCDILADAMKMTELEVKSPEVEKTSVEAQEKSADDKVEEKTIANDGKSPVVEEEKGPIDVSASLVNRADGHYNKTYKRKCIGDGLLKHR